MDRAIPVGNKTCAARVHKRYEDQRKQRLRDMKPQIDATKPKTSGMAHLKQNWKRDEMLGCRFDEIERDNKHLLHAMSKMIQEHGEGTPHQSRSVPSLSMASGAGARFPGGPARRNEIARIEFENARMLKRLQNSEAVYRTKDWEASYDHSRPILRRCCEYPLPEMKLKRKVRSTSSLMPLMSEEESRQASMDPGAVAPDFSSPSSHGLKYVLKEERIIDGINFYVEMATDGQTLAVSAYNKNIQDTLELLVNEDNHRQLLFESNGDYVEISSRLHIKDDRLVIISAEEVNSGQV